MNEWKNIIESMHKEVCEALKDSKPGTPEWKLCMTMIKAYESWVLNKENEKCGFMKNGMD
jgi:hypothetical protein